MRWSLGIALAAALVFGAPSPANSLPAQVDPAPVDEVPLTVEVTAPSLILVGDVLEVVVQASGDGQATVEYHNGTGWIPSAVTGPVVEGAAVLAWRPGASRLYRVSLDTAVSAEFYVGVGTQVAVDAPDFVKSGSTAQVVVRTAPGHNATLRVSYRTSTTWTASSITVAVVNGVGRATWKPSSGKTYLISGAGLTSQPFSIALRSADGSAVSARATAATYFSGELVWLTGQVTVGDAPRANAQVTIERRKVSSGSWSTVGTATTRSTGGYSYRFRPSDAYLYRARFTSTGATSAPLHIEHASGGRGLLARQADLAWLTGTPTTSVRTVAPADLPAGVSGARYREFQRGTLVEVTKGSSVRTWYVYDRIGTTYASLDGWEGKLGLPMSDAKCGLMEGACVQRFTGGALYQNAAGVYAAYGTVEEVEILAAARSQAPKSWPGPRADNKYNEWINGTSAWCEVFVVWSAWAGGHPGWVPYRKTYVSFVDDARAAGVLHFNQSPPVGSVAFTDWGTGVPTHSFLVSGRNGGNLYTIEGNTSNGIVNVRGVFERVRPASAVWAWFWPHEYAAATS